MLASHTRSHGAPPKEPWEYGKDFLNSFREATEMRYKLMPYIYAQAKDCSERGLPMVRAMFVEYPNDPGAWLVDDQYLFGSDILVAPFFEKASERNVYLPQGQWIDYQSGQSYQGGWHSIKAGNIPVVMLVRAGSVIPHIKLAQSTAQMDWKNLELVLYGQDKGEGLVYLPGDEQIHKVIVNKQGSNLSVVSDPLKGKVNWKISSYKK